MSKKNSWSRYWTPSAFSWPALFWPAPLNVAAQQSGWRQSWKEAWSEAWTGPWSYVRGDDDAGFAGLPASSVVALVGLAFEARIAAGPGVLVICRGGGSAYSDEVGRGFQAKAAAHSD